jgi:hypothetical protein
MTLTAIAGGWAAASWFSVHAGFFYLLTPLFFIVPPTSRDFAPTGTAAKAQ